jgi:hypothetical protein
MFCNYQANPICDGKSFHRMTGTFYAWLSLTNMKDNNMLTRVDSRNNPSSGYHKAPNMQPEHSTGLKDLIIQMLNQFLVIQRTTITD